MHVRHSQDAQVTIQLVQIRLQNVQVIVKHLQVRVRKKRGPLISGAVAQNNIQHHKDVSEQAAKSKPENNMQQHAEREQETQ
jgi:hypothetical protein